jgi:hypothetical protein
MDKNHYLKQSIELTKASKESITLNTSIIYEFPNDNELGREIRRKITEKLDNADKDIKDFQNLINERTQ